MFGPELKLFDESNVWSPLKLFDEVVEVVPGPGWSPAPLAVATRTVDGNSEKSL